MSVSHKLDLVGTHLLARQRAQGSIRCCPPFCPQRWRVVDAQ